MASPDDRTYLESHEWHKLEGDTVTVGISQPAVEELTDITFIEFTQSEGHINAGDPFGEIESVKATSELYSGIDGEVVEVNHEVEENPATINEDCYNKGWMIKIRPDDPSQVETLLSSEQYEAKAGQ